MNIINKPKNIYTGQETTTIVKTREGWPPKKKIFFKYNNKY